MSRKRPDDTDSRVFRRLIPLGLVLCGLGGVLIWADYSRTAGVLIIAGALCALLALLKD